MRYLDALLRPLAVLPPGLPVVVEAPADVTEALAALGLAVAPLQQTPADGAAWGVLVCSPGEARTLAERLRPHLAPGAWLSVVSADAEGPTALVGALEDVGYAVAQLPEAVTGVDGAAAYHLVVRRVDPGVVA